MSAFAVFLVGFATAAVTVTLTAKAPITSATMTFFTIFPSIFIRIGTRLVVYCCPAILSARVTSFAVLVPHRSTATVAGATKLDLFWTRVNVGIGPILLL